MNNLRFKHENISYGYLKNNNIQQNILLSCDSCLLQCYSLMFMHFLTVINISMLSIITYIRPKKDNNIYFTP